MGLMINPLRAAWDRNVEDVLAPAFSFDGCLVAWCFVYLLSHEKSPDPVKGRWVPPKERRGGAVFDLGEFARFDVITVLFIK